MAEEFNKVLTINDLEHSEGFTLGFDTYENIDADYYGLVGKGIQEVIYAARDDFFLDLESLKLLSFPIDFNNSVYYWQQQLEQQKSLTDSDTEIACAKTIHWLNNNSLQHIILCKNELFLGIGHHDSNLANFMKSCLLHEFAHVHDDKLGFADQGIDYFSVEYLPNEFEKFLAILSRIMFSEFFAQATSFCYTKKTNDWEDNNKKWLFDIIKKIDQLVTEKLTEFQQEKCDYLDVWYYMVCVLAEQIKFLSYPIGNLTASKIDDFDTPLIKILNELNSYSPFWSEIIASQAEIFEDILYSASRKTDIYINLKKNIIEILNKICHVYPILEDDNLSVYVL